MGGGNASPFLTPAAVHRVARRWRMLLSSGGSAVLVESHDAGRTPASRVGWRGTGVAR